MESGKLKRKQFPEYRHTDITSYAAATFRNIFFPNLVEITEIIFLNQYFAVNGVKSLMKIANKMDFENVYNYN